MFKALTALMVFHFICAEKKQTSGIKEHTSSINENDCNFVRSIGVFGQSMTKILMSLLPLVALVVQALLACMVFHCSINMQTSAIEELTWSVNCIALNIFESICFLVGQ